MNDKDKKAEDTGRSVTLDCVDFWVDEPGDHTVRPCRPEHLEHAMAQRAMIQAAEAAKESTQNGKPS